MHKLLLTLYLSYFFFTTTAHALDLKVKVLPESLATNKIVLEIQVPNRFVVSRVEYKLINLDDPVLYQNFTETDIKERRPSVFYIEMDRDNFEKGEYMVDMIITTNHFLFTEWTSKLTTPQFNSAMVKFKVPSRYVEY